MMRDDGTVRRHHHPHRRHPPALDHIGGFAQFPVARFHAQDDEMSFATGAMLDGYRRCYELASSPA
ncbi:MAG: hypothetical protein ACFCVK_12100 [Acidimicrobiales bacterium]